LFSKRLSTQGWWSYWSRFKFTGINGGNMPLRHHCRRQQHPRNALASNPGYWSGTEWVNGALSTDSAWDFFTSNGDQQHSAKNVLYYALPMAPGEVGLPVPLPATAWLLLTGVGGLGVMLRKRRDQTTGGAVPNGYQVAG
jgi:hypothetical protein